MVEFTARRVLWALMCSHRKPVEGDYHKYNNKNDGCIKNDFFGSAARLIKPDAFAAQESGHAGWALLKENKGNNGDGEYDLDDGNHKLVKSIKFLPGTNPPWAEKVHIRNV